MERREDILRQAIDKNVYETERWQAYKADNETAIANLKMFSKKLSVEVMVPIGKKALMPGHLIHTNELVVGHYQGYFSACTAYKAKEICQHRIRQADEHLKKLEVEANLWQNKLETPLQEGAMPNADEVEIVEDYNEEAHNNWLRDHRESVRKQKLLERSQREALNNEEEDVFKKLEERDMLQELGLDPDNFDEQAINHMISGESATESIRSEDCDKNSESAMTDEQIFDILDKLEAQENHENAEIDTDLEQNIDSTNEMVRNLMKSSVEITPSKRRVGRLMENGETPIKGAVNTRENNKNDMDDEDESDLPEEVKLIRDQLQLLPKEERQELLTAQLNIIKAKMRKIQKTHFINNELTHLMNVVVCLEDDLHEMLFEQVQESVTDNEPSDDEELVPVNNTKRRISFAKTDEELLFLQHETVAEMLPKGKQKEQAEFTARDVITLDAPLQHVKKVNNSQNFTKQNSPQILQKVEQNLDFVHQHQSVKDFDMVNQILEASTGQIKTLHITFEHSEATAADETDFDTQVPGNPSHFYQLYKNALAKQQSEHEFPIYVNSFEGEQELKVPILKEEARDAAYDDPRAEFFNPVTNLEDRSCSATDVESIETKSILRNKAAVELEGRAPQPSQPHKSKKNKNKIKKKPTIDDALGDMSAYQKVMQDIIETEAPEPLPEGKYIDAHVPKRRISRFKEQRSKNKA